MVLSPIIQKVFNGYLAIRQPHGKYYLMVTWPSGSHMANIMKGVSLAQVK
uniref:Uncharacterized protein n=1 Tax=Arundo donax TaxID=35708 RepID=A0A0A9SG58_ARUDO